MGTASRGITNRVDIACSQWKEIIILIRKKVWKVTTKQVHTHTHTHHFVWHHIRNGWRNRHDANTIWQRWTIIRWSERPLNDIINYECNQICGKSKLNFSHRIIIIIFDYPQKLLPNVVAIRSDMNAMRESFRLFEIRCFTAWHNNYWVSIRMCACFTLFSSLLGIYTCHFINYWLLSWYSFESFPIHSEYPLYLSGSKPPMRLPIERSIHIKAIGKYNKAINHHYSNNIERKQTYWVRYR